MLKAMLRGLLAHKLRLLLSALAIVLGTAFMSAAFVGGDTISKGFNDMFSQINENLDVQVTGKSDVPGAPDGSQVVTAVVPEGVARSLSGVDGVAEATPQVASDGARVIDRNGKAVASTEPPRLGIGWPADPAAQPMVQMREGEPPGTANQVAISKNLADVTGYEIGSQIDVITLEPRQPFTVTGIVGVSADRDSLGGETYVVFTEPRAQRLMLGRTGVYSNVDLKARPGVSPEQLKVNVRRALGGDYEVLTAQETAVKQAGPIQTFLNVFKTALWVFGLLGLITGLFLIFNTFSMLVAQRTRELALYRSFGANKRQVLDSVLVESILLGLISSIVGLAIGVGLGWLLKWGLGAASGNPLPGTGVVLRPVVVATTLLAGTLITMLAALLPAIRASRVAPLEAMRSAAKPDKPLSRLTIAGLVLLVAGICLLVLKGTDTLDNALVTLGGGSLLVFLGAVLLAPALSRPVTRGIGKLVDWATPGRLGVRNTGRNPRRTALTAAALMIGVTLATGAGLFASSVKSGVTELFRQDLGPADQLKQATSFLDLLLLILNFLLGLTILVAVLGVINTLLLSVFERTRELGMLRAVGMSRGRVGWMITVESVLISLFGALMGMVLGTGLGIALVKILGGEFLKLTIPWGYLVTTLAAAIIVGGACGAASGRPGRQTQCAASHRLRVAAVPAGDRDPFSRGSEDHNLEIRLTAGGIPILRLSGSSLRAE